MVAVSALALATFAPMPSRAMGSSVVDVPLTFHVVNSSVTKCRNDNKPYTIRGNLVAPADALTDTTHDAVTLYLHGSGDGSVWHFTAVPGVDYVSEMARLGHVSVFIHNLGYGASDAADGNAVCFGSFVTIAHQVVQELRKGIYGAGGKTPVAFERVALVGISAGGIDAELYSITYHDIDALGIVGWADNALTVTGFYPDVVGDGLACARGGESKTAGGPSGWVRVFRGRDWDSLLYNMDPFVRQSFVARYEDDPCGVLSDAGQAIGESIALSPTVTIPVLLAYGDHDPFPPGAFEIQRARYVSSPDVSLAVLPNTGHVSMLGRTAPEFRAVMSGWLGARAF